LSFLWIMLTATSIPLKLHQSKSMFNKLIHIIISLTMMLLCPYPVQSSPAPN
jgi:hypothetical protein